MASFDVSSDGLKVSGLLDGDAEREFKDNLEAMLAGDADPVTIDLSEVVVIVSVCIGAFIVFWIDSQEAGKRIRLIPSPVVMRVLDLTGLAAVMLRDGALARPVSD